MYYPVCLSQFPSLTEVTSHSCDTSCTEGGNSPELRIFPMMMITCNGLVRRLTVAGRFGTMGESFPELQIWRPASFVTTSTTFIRTATLPFPRDCDSLPNNVQQCTLSTPLSVSSGDIIGLLLPPNINRQARFRVYFTGTSTPSYILDRSMSLFTLPSTPGPADANAQPLIYLEIGTG